MERRCGCGGSKRDDLAGDTPESLLRGGGGGLGRHQLCGHGGKCTLARQRHLWHSGAQHHGRGTSWRVSMSVRPSTHPTHTLH